MFLFFAATLKSRSEICRVGSLIVGVSLTIDGTSIDYMAKETLRRQGREGCFRAGRLGYASLRLVTSGQNRPGGKLHEQTQASRIRGP